MNSPITAMKQNSMSPTAARAVLYGGCACLLISTVIVRLCLLSAPWLVFSWGLLLPVVQLLLAGVVAVRCRDRAIWWHLLLTSLVAVLLACAMYVDALDFVWLPLADFVFHIILPACWLFALAGLLTMPFLLRHRHLAVLRVWVFLAVALVVAEPASWWMMPDRHLDLDLPDTLESPADGTIHVAAIGGSTTLGHPYQPKFGFADVIGWRLQDLYPERRIVVHNLAFGGANLRMAARRLHQLKVRPHLLVIYTGHNEFYHQMSEFQEKPTQWAFVNSWMEWSALFRFCDRWLARNQTVQQVRYEPRSLIDVPIATPPLREERLERFRRQCQQLSDFCERESISPLWFVPAASESGFEPNRSGDRRLLSEREQQDLRELFAQASTAEHHDAIRLYQSGLKQHPAFAELHFRLAERLVHVARFSEALDHFGSALDYDGFPVRANRAYRQVIRETAKHARAAVVETSEYLRRATPHGILGDELFLDNVHMTVKGYYLTGLAGCEVIVTREILTGMLGPAASVPPLTLRDAITRAGLDRDDLARAYKQTASSLHELKRWRYDPARREQAARRFEQISAALAAGDISPGESGTETLSSE